MQSLEPWSWVAGIGSFLVSFVALLLAAYTAWPTFVARREEKRKRKAEARREEIRELIQEELAYEEARRRRARREEIRELIQDELARGEARTPEHHETVRKEDDYGFTASSSSVVKSEFPRAWGSGFGDKLSGFPDQPRDRYGKWSTESDVWLPTATEPYRPWPRSALVLARVSMVTMLVGWLVLLVTRFL